MGWGAGRKLGLVLDNTVRVLAVEALCAAQGIELRAPLSPAPATASALRKLRDVVPALDQDRPLGPDIEAVGTAIEHGLFDDLPG